jgi:glutamyl-tRNA reductase
LLANAEIIISAVSGASQVITADEIAQTASRKCLLIDLAFPRSIDRAIKEIPGPSLYDLDDLEHAIKTPAAASESEIEAQRIILEEVMAFRSELLALDKAPGIGALKQRLDEICRQELESFRLERGPFPKDQDRLLAAVGNRITHRIAGSLTRELNDGSQFAERIKAAV